MEKVIIKLSKELNLPYEVIENSYKAYWEYIKETIKNIPLDKELTEEEFNKYKTNFNIPNLGKLVCTYDRYKNIKKRIKIIKENVKYKKDKTNG